MIAYRRFGPRLFLCIAYLVVLSVFAALPALGQGCSAARNNPFAFATEIFIQNDSTNPYPFPDQFQSGADFWNNGCNGGGGTQYPSFAAASGTPEVIVRYLPGLRPQEHPTCQCYPPAEFDDTHPGEVPVITVYGQYQGRDETSPHDTNLLSNGINIIAHELGHALGLADTPSSCTDSNSIMHTVSGNPRATPEDCSTADLQHRMPNEGPNRPPFSPPRVGCAGVSCSGAASPWFRDCDDYTGDHTDCQDGGSVLICVDLNNNGSSNDDGECQYGENLNCTNIHTGGTDRFYGPSMTLVTPHTGATVRGKARITGSAVDRDGIWAVAFFVDEQQVQVERYSYGEPSPNACQSVGGSQPYCNTNNGFSAWLDTTALSSGSHKLWVVAGDALPMMPMPSMIERMLSVQACTTNPPAASITQPANQQVVGGSVSVAVTAGGDSEIWSVDLLLDGALLASDVSLPFDFVWNASNASEGNHTLQARAHDGCGHDGSSSVVTVTVRNDRTPPAIQIVSPGNGGYVSGNRRVTASASDDVGVTKVEFLVDGALQATVTSMPFRFIWPTASFSETVHSLTAIAYDASGKHTTSAAVTVTVDKTNPRMYVDFPQPNQTLSGSSAVLAGWATDGSKIASVTFTVDSKNWLPPGGSGYGQYRPDVCRAVPVGDPNCPNVGWRATLDSTGLADGVHTLQVKATDSSGLTVISDNRAFKVDNTKPRLWIDSPADSAAVVGSAVSVAGWATDTSRVGSLAFQVDNGKLDLNSPYQYGVSRQDVCNANPIGDPNCPNVGWNGAFDSTRLPNGAHILQVTASDTLGLAATIQRSFQVSNGNSVPVVRITAPSEGASVSGTIPVNAYATDDLGVTRVEFYIDNALKGTDTSSPFSYSWNTTSAAEGSHNLYARAFDASQTYSTSSTVHVTVDNVHPTIRLVVEGGTVITRQATYTFPSTPKGVAVSRLFTIYNDGNETLTISNPNSLVTGTAFFEIQNAPSQIPPGASGTFRVRLLSNNPGAYSGSVTIQGNQPAGPFAFTVKGTVTDTSSLPTLPIEGPGGLPVAPGDIVPCPSPPDGVPVPCVFSLLNPTDATLFINNADSLITGSAFALVENLAAQLEPGEVGEFALMLTSTAAGTYTGSVTIDTGSVGAGPFIFDVTAKKEPVSAGEITVADCSGNPMPAAGLYSFGATSLGSSVPCLFTVLNHSTGPINIVNTAFTAGSGFRQLGALPATIPSGESASFWIVLAADSVGIHTATVRVDTGSPTVGSISFGLTGLVYDNVLTPLRVAACDTTLISIGDVLGLPKPSFPCAFTVLNDTISKVRISNPNALLDGTCFLLAQPLPQEINPAGSATFVVSLLGGLAQSCSDVITIETDAVGAQPFSFVIHD